MYTNSTTLSGTAEKNGKNVIAASLSRIAKAFRAWRRRMQAAQQCDMARELKNRFAVTERHGRLFLTCDGVAFQEIDSTHTAGQICDMILAARMDAQQFTELRR